MTQKDISYFPKALNLRFEFLKRPVKKTYAPYVFLLLLIIFPPLLIRSKTIYPFYGDLFACIWSAGETYLLFYVAARYRPTSKQLGRAWTIIATSALFSFLGNLFWFGMSHFLHIYPYPSVADIFYLLSYPLMLIGILSFPYTSKTTLEKLKIYLETATVVISIGMALWFFVLRPVIDQTGTSDKTYLFFTVAYLSVDTILFMALWILVTHRSVYLSISTKIQLGLGILLLILSDTIFLVQDIQGLYFETVRFTDLTYNLSSAFIGAAALYQWSTWVELHKVQITKYWVMNLHRLFSDVLLFLSFCLFVYGHQSNQFISFEAVSFWVGCLILISIALQRLDGREIYILNKNLQKLNLELEGRVQARTAELTVVNADLEKAMRAKDEFMAAMSHELRTPLTGILGGAGALQGSTDDTLSDKQKKSVNLIERNGHRLLSLVNDLIDYSRLQSGKQILFKSPYALTDICIAVLRSVETDAKRKKQSVSLQSQPEGIIVDTDVTLMKKMLIHLLRNASKFTPEGGEFGISLTEKSEQHCVEVVVWDTGIGIKKSDIANIFTPFVQLDATLARKYEGTGLGLAIVNKLVELFDGKMDVFSTPGSGSRFVILLPWKGPTEQ